MHSACIDARYYTNVSNIDHTILVLLFVNKISNSTLPVTLWGDKAAIFDADTIYNAGQTQPQVIVFVGTLVKDYPGLGIFPLHLSIALLSIFYN